jgi:chromosome segregation ATPase
MMKTTKAVIFLLVIIGLTGCKYKKQTEQLLIEKQDLTSQLAKSDSTLKVYMSVLTDVETKLNALLPEGAAAGEQPAGEDISARLDRTLSAIAASFQETERKYQAMRSRYAGANSKVAELEKEVNDLKVVVEKKDSVINSLKTEISELTATVDQQAARIDDLTGKNSEMSDKIDLMTGDMNTAYYVAGTVDELKSKNIIIKAGGFLGFLGRVNVLSPGLTKSSLEKIDIRETTTFTLKADIKKVQLITHHPSGSYEMKTVDPETVSLMITDAAKFWEGSRYLVIVF